MAKIAYRVRNWKDYNRSLVQRRSLTFWFSKDIFDQQKIKNDIHGNQKYSDMVIL